MRWLHFSDFHLKAKPGAQDDAMASLIDFLGTICAQLKIDAVFLVGDISFSARKMSLFVLRNSS